MGVCSRWVAAGWCWAAFLPLAALSSPIETDVASIPHDLEIIEGVEWCKTPPAATRQYVASGGGVSSRLSRATIAKSVRSTMRSGCGCACVIRHPTILSDGCSWVVLGTRT